MWKGRRRTSWYLPLVQVDVQIFQQKTLEREATDTMVDMICCGVESVLDTRVKMGRKRLNSFLSLWRKTKATQVEKMSNVEEAQVPGGKVCIMEGMTTRVTRKVWQRLKDEFHASLMARRGMRRLMEKRRRYTRSVGMGDSEHVVRECKAMAEEELWSVWNQVKKQVHTESAVSQGKGDHWEFGNNSKTTRLSCIGWTGNWRLPKESGWAKNTAGLP